MKITSEGNKANKKKQIRTSINFITEIEFENFKLVKEKLGANNLSDTVRRLVAEYLKVK